MMKLDGEIPFSMHMRMCIGICDATAAKMCRNFVEKAGKAGSCCQYWKKKPCEKSSYLLQMASKKVSLSNSMQITTLYKVLLRDT